MAEKNLFEQVFSPVGQAIRGTARGLFPGAARVADEERKRIESLLKSEKAQRLISKARAASLDRGEGYYGRSTTKDPIDQISKLITAADKTVDDKLSESLNKRAQELLDGIVEEEKRGKKEAKLGFSPEGADPIDVGIRLGGGLESLPKTSSVPADYFQPGPTPITTPPKLDDFFSPPRTYEQLGITNIDNQETLGEMQKAMPDRDMRQEYEADPEYMQKLINLWKEGKLNKSNLHKAFSAIQQRARQSLGIA